MMVGRGSLALCFALASHRCGTIATCLLVVKLQVLQALRQGQFLLDGHTQQRIQGLLLVLSSSQLPLHVIQLGHVLVTPERKRGGENKNNNRGGRGGRKKKEERYTLFPAGGAICFEVLLPSHVFSIPQTAFSRWEDEVSES